MKAVSRVAASGDRRSNRELAIRGRRKRRSCPYSSASLFPLPAVKAIATGIVAFIFAPLVSLSQEKIVVLTFDDAVKSHRTFVAPYLKELGFGATFFVTYRWMEDQDNFMTWEDIKEIHELGFEIGNHTWTHRDMGDPQNVHILAGE
ncbi:MAG TPA: hypothetical protein DIV79_10020, partial [Opitutae bacterium]|nr:hypothetical protein [Opitutae bacterium]